MESREGLRKPYMMRTFAFGSALDTVGGGHDDPVGVAVGAFSLLLALAHSALCAFSTPPLKTI